MSAGPDATHPLVSIKDSVVVDFNDRWHVHALTSDMVRLIPLPLAASYMS